MTKCPYTPVSSICLAVHKLHPNVFRNSMALMKTVTSVWWIMLSVLSQIAVRHALRAQPTRAYSAHTQTVVTTLNNVPDGLSVMSLDLKVSTNREGSTDSACTCLQSRQRSAISINTHPVSSNKKQQHAAQLMSFDRKACIAR